MQRFLPSRCFSFPHLLGPCTSPARSLSAANLTYPHFLHTSHPASTCTCQPLFPPPWVPRPLPDPSGSWDTVPYLWSYQNPLFSSGCHRKASQSLSSQSYWATCCTGCREKTGLCPSLSPRSYPEFILPPPSLPPHPFPLQQVGLHFIHSDITMHFGCVFWRGRQGLTLIRTR